MYSRYQRLIAGKHLDLWIALVGAALFSLESWALGPASWIYGYGSGLETIPALKALAFDDRNFSLWAPFVAGGIDRLAFWANANPVGPEILLFSALPTWLANGLHRFLQYFVAIYFTARVADEQLALKGAWASLAGVMYGCFSYFTVGALFTLPGVPLMLWLLWRSVGEPGGYAKAIGSALLLSFCTTFTFGVPYLLTLAVLWLALVQRPDWPKALGHIAAFSLALIIATSPQLFAVAINAPLSSRAEWDMERFSLSIDGLFYRQLQFDIFDQNKALRSVTMNLPWLGFFLGVPLAWFGWRRRGSDKAVAASFVTIAVIFALLSQKWAWLLVQTAVSHFAPFFSGFYMGRFFQIPAPFLIATGLTLAMRLAWPLVCEHQALRRIFCASVAALVAFMLITPKAHLFYDLGVNDWGEANYEVRAVDELRQQPGLFRVASVLPLHPAYAYAQGLETVDGWANLYPAVYRDLWLRVLAPLFSEIPFNRQIFGADTGRPEDVFILLGADLVRPGTGLLPGEDLNDAMRIGFDIDRRFNLELLRLLNVRYLLSEYPLRSSRVRLVHAADPWPTWPQYRSRNTGLVEGPRRPSEPHFGRTQRFLQPVRDAIEATRRKLRGKDIFVYELTGTLDRFRFVENVEVESGRKAVLDRLSSMNSAEMRASAVTEAADALLLARLSGLAIGRVDVIRYRPSQIGLKVTVPGDAFLIIGNTWSPFWKATLNGNEVRLIRANHAQYGLAVPRGSHEVVLTYRPPVLGLFFGP